MSKHFWLYGSRALANIGKTLCGLILGLAVGSEAVSAATYYISPSGSDSNNGTSSSSPWLTFSRAMSTMVCGDTLTLMNGVYGDGTNTGKLSISSKPCTASTPMTIRALNQRQARINDNGSGIAILITGTDAAPTAYLVLDGLIANSADLNSGISGIPVRMDHCNRCTVRNSLFYNPNRYHNVHPIIAEYIYDSIYEDNEIYKYHRHGIGISGARDVIRRLYCNPRDGGIAGGYGNGGGNADACVSLYPTMDSIMENVISDRGTASGGYLNETNALGTNSGNKILGSIGYRPRVGSNAIYINARSSGGTWWYPTNTYLENNVIYGFEGSTGYSQVSAIGTTLKNMTVIGAGNNTGVVGSYVDINQPGSIAMTNILAVNSDNGVVINGSMTNWTGNYVNAYGNTNNSSPSTHTNWNPSATTTSINPSLGTCIAWIPDGSPMKRAGANGADIGANILYRYVNGALTSTPLWNPTTGEFPHGAIVPGLNDVPGQSVFDVHKRLNVNTNGCLFPASYGGTGDSTAPTPPEGLRIF